MVNIFQFQFQTNKHHKLELINKQCQVYFWCLLHFFAEEDSTTN